MIFHIFNSSLISGPETLVMPALTQLNEPAKIILLRESRISDEKQQHVIDYIQKLRLEYQIIPVHSRFDSQAIQKLADILEQAGPQLRVAHAHDVKPSAYLLKAAQKIKNRGFAIISTHHGVRARHGVINRLYELFYSYRILPGFDRILTVCTKDRERLLGRGLKADKIIVHLNGATREKVLPQERAGKQRQIRQAWGLDLSAGHFVFGVAARLEPEKRHTLLLDVVREITRQAPHFKFLVLCFGRGSQEALLREKCTRSGLDSFVQWRGYRSGLGDEFAGFDALLSLSEAEGLPINLIEAGWAATPIFACAVDGVPDLVSNARLGALVGAHEKPEIIANKILQFANSLPSLEEKGREFQKHVESHFSQEQWIQKLVEIYAAFPRANRSEV